jgi:hypothetical protein
MRRSFVLVHELTFSHVYIHMYVQFTLCDGCVHFNIQLWYFNEIKILHTGEKCLKKCLYHTGEKMSENFSVSNREKMSLSLYDTGEKMSEKMSLSKHGQELTGESTASDGKLKRQTEETN